MYFPEESANAHFAFMLSDLLPLQSGLSLRAIYFFPSQRLSTSCWLFFESNGLINKTVCAPCLKKRGAQTVLFIKPGAQSKNSHDAAVSAWRAPSRHWTAARWTEAVSKQPRFVLRRWSI